jgi:hypothetical protein
MSFWKQGRDLLIRKEQETSIAQEQEAMRTQITQEPQDALKEIEAVIEALLKAKNCLQVSPVLLLGERATLWTRIMDAIMVAGRIRHAIKQTEMYKK